MAYPECHSGFFFKHDTVYFRNLHKRHMITSRSGRKQNREANTWICIPSVHSGLANLSENEQQALKLFIVQEGWELSISHFSQHMRTLTRMHHGFVRRNKLRLIHNDLAFALLGIQYQ